MGLAQYWYPVVFAGFILMVAGAMLLLVGTLTEKGSECQNRSMNRKEQKATFSKYTSSDQSYEHASEKHPVQTSSACTGPHA
ncbi:MAG TPA: hypothetical protein VNA15_01445 [Candidatus Angelobacter sp.]|nr:hypothetical protein [Candidatus Angelobacter sp.]